MTLVWAPGFNGVTDPDAQTYIAAVETADSQAIEGDVALAINDFVVGCKLDGIWDAIKASCILAGARTLNGALVPLKGTAPTNYNFVAADYNRETGLKGGSGKYLDPARANNDDPQNSRHMTVYATEADSSAGAFFMGTDSLGVNGASGFFSNSGNVNYGLSGTGDTGSISNSIRTGLMGASRSSSTGFTYRQNQTSTDTSISSAAPTSSAYQVFSRTGQGATIDSRLSFYSIGEAIDLEKLDTRTTRLMNLLSYSLASGLPALSTMDLDAASYIGGAYRAGATLS